MERQDSYTLPNPSLPLWELSIYVVTWIVIVLRMLVALFETSRDYAEHREVSYGLDEGWSFLGRQKDVSDTEWEFWMSSVFGSFGKWLVGHVILGQIVRIPQLFPKRKYVFLVYSILFYVNVVGFGQLLLIILEVFIIFSIVWFTASSVLVWVFSLLFLLALNIDTLRVHLFTVGFLGRRTFQEYLFQDFTLAMTMQRLVSFGLFNCDYKKKTMARATQSEFVKTESSPTNNRVASEDESAKSLSTDGCRNNKVDLKAEAMNGSTVIKDHEARLSWDIKAFSCGPLEQLIDMFVYIFYIPLMVAGPMMNYDVFYKQFYGDLQPWSVARLKVILTGLFRSFFWGFVNDLLLHFLYSGPIITRPSLLSVLPLWAIGGIGYMHAMFFVLKYMVVWGFCASIARLDQLQPPDVPNCGSHVYQYSTMWKTFDRGLYGFMKQHVYVQFGGSRYGLLRQIVALSLCFGFVSLWHGLSYSILVWCLFNFLCILLEVSAGRFVSSTPVQEFEARFFSPATIRRLHSLAIMPVLGVSLFSIVTFFAGIKSGNAIFRRVIFEGFPVSTILFAVSLYCMIQTGKEVENYQSKRQHSKVD